MVYRGLGGIKVHVSGGSYAYENLRFLSCLVERLL
jgi:hypothetical protein